MTDRPDLPTTMRAVRFDRFGGVDELRVEEVPVPHPGPGEVLVRVIAAGINPGEIAIREGAFAPESAVFPSGQGSDLAGVVVAVGDGAPGLAPGDEVLGYSWTRSSQAEYAAVPARQLIAKPAGMDWEVAGSLYVAGATAWAAVEAVDPGPEDTVVVSAAAGGVGRFVTQLLRYRGARVVGIASARNADWLRGEGATPMTYGDGLAGRIREAAPDGVDAFIDLHGDDYVDLAVELGVAPARIDTIIGYRAAARTGAQTKGSVAGSSQRVLAGLASLVVDRMLVPTVQRTFPLDAVRDAYRELADGHAQGKIVLRIG